MQWKLMIVLVVLGIGFIGFVSSGDINSSSEDEKNSSSTFINPNRIGDSEVNWIFEVVKQDELGVNITAINETAFRVIPFSVDEIKTDKVDYRWKTRLNYTLNEINHETLLSSNLDKNELDKEFIISIPDGLTKFTIFIGESSTRIDASAAGIALGYSDLSSICQTSDGVMHMAYEGADHDFWYGNNSGGTWSAREIVAGSYIYAGILCYTNDTVGLVGIDEGAADIVVYSLSNDLGKSFPAFRTLEGDEDFDTLSCAMSDDNVGHCCMIDNDDDVWYVNTSNPDFHSGEIDSLGGYDHCAIGVNSTYDSHIVISEGGTDDLDIMISTDNWVSRSSIHDSLGTVSTTLREGLSYEIRDDIHYVSGIFSDDLQFCRGTAYDSFSCQELDASTSSNSDIAVTDNNEIFILYQVGASGNLGLANSSDDGTSWDLNRTFKAGLEQHPSMASSDFPSWNNITTTIHFGFSNLSGVYYDSLSVLDFIPQISFPSTIKFEYFESIIDNQFGNENKNQYKGQRFRVGNLTAGSYTLKGVTVMFYRGSTASGELAFEIRAVTSDGLPNSTVLSRNTSFSVGGITTDSNGEYYNITMQEVDLKEGSNYSLVFNCTACGSNENKVHWKINSTGGKAYDAGNVTISDDQGSTWSTFDFDYYFQLWGDETSGDTCTCASDGTNWEIDMSDNCVLSTPCDIGLGNITFINTGTFHCDSNLNVSHLQSIANGGLFWVNDSCDMHVKGAT